jgi:hypothetical protein
VQPGRSVVLPPGQHWQSVCQEQDDAAATSPERSDRASAFWAVHHHLKSVPGADVGQVGRWTQVFRETVAGTGYTTFYMVH